MGCTYVIIQDEDGYPGMKSEWVIVPDCRRLVWRELEETFWQRS